MKGYTLDPAHKTGVELRHEWKFRDILKGSKSRRREAHSERAKALSPLRKVILCK